MRTGSGSMRADSPSLFYPIFVSKDGHHFLGVGDVVPLGVDRNTVKTPDDCFAVWPLRSDGQEGRWRYSRDSLLDIQKRGFVKLGGFTKQSMAISYVSEGWQNKIESGIIKTFGRHTDGSWILDDSDYVHGYIPNNQWAIPSHNATEFGTKLLQSIVGKRFSYPKSLYAVHDVIRFFTADKPDAVIVDFFAGSGTTLHAVNLLNAEDGGQRRCIMVTNNEVSVDEAKELSEKGVRPGDETWNNLGIARYVTWPRTVCSIEGHDVNGLPLKGNYIGNDKPMADGFKANAAFFKLGFLDRNSVALGRQFKDMLPTLWMKAGAIGPCPALNDETLPEMLVLPENKFAVLLDERYYLDFVMKLDEYPEIKTVYIVTDSDAGYRDMIMGMEDKDTYQLYRDYLDNFRINSVRR
jgi:adenine-specific DNA-methyltransferase